jgi:hypothetical protein
MIGPYAALMKELLFRYHNAAWPVLGLKRTKSVFPSPLKSEVPMGV